MVDHPASVKGSNSVEILSVAGEKQARRHPAKQGGLLPQVSGRSRKSLEDSNANDAYSVGNAKDNKLSGGLNGSPSVISLHD